MRFAILLLALAGCATTTVPPATNGIRVPIVWHENEMTRDAICGIAEACYRWKDNELHVYTAVIRHEYQLCGVGHEVFHGVVRQLLPVTKGHFHDGKGNWIIKR